MLRRRAFGFGGKWSAFQTALAVAGPVASALAAWGRLDAVPFALVVVVPAPLVLAVLALSGRSRWAAQEVIAWLDSVRERSGAASDDAAAPDAQAAPSVEQGAALAYRAAVDSTSRGLDGLAALAAARPDAGALSSKQMVRLWLIRLRYAIASAVVGAWVLAAILVAMATAGGVVWF
jgi:hypothetical protein